MNGLVAFTVPFLVEDVHHDFTKNDKVSAKGDLTNFRQRYTSKS
jgi:hypothetical protein